ncbi:MAG TPA: twin-arginine translocation signal domain-containing protein [Chromatiales bacterium]|nr:twin-arginine translocation signal domain-containing protein [Thiotrichales bacterium]HIP67048.1 twin-arginine translocation signal domain-containing protein [Chromatiales bacterium]
MKSKQFDTKRRQFLKNATTLSAGAAVVVASPGVIADAPEKEMKKEVQAEGYRLTQHILDYYKTAAS